MRAFTTLEKVKKGTLSVLTGLHSKFLKFPSRLTQKSISLEAGLQPRALQLPLGFQRAPEEGKGMTIGPGH